MNQVRALTGVLLAAAILSAPTSAFAHGELVAASPVAGETVGRAPHNDLWFSTPVADWTLTVEQPDKTLLAGKAVQKAPPYLSFEAVALTQEGVHIVRYSTFDSDGDVLEGAYTFTYEQGGPGPTPLGVDLAVLQGQEPTPWWYYAVLMGGVVVIAVLAGTLAEKYRRLRSAPRD